MNAACVGSNPTVLPKLAMRDLDKESNSKVYKVGHRRVIAKETGGCDRCSPHGGENQKRRAKPNKHKNKKRSTIRRGE